jgi:hypothetical protein
MKLSFEAWGCQWSLSFADKNDLAGEGGQGDTAVMDFY